MPSPTPSSADLTLSRRAFVALTATTTVAGAIASTTRAAAAAGTPTAPRSISHDVFDVEERSVAEWQAALAKGELTSRQLVERYLQRIESLDARGPTLRAVLETNPDAFDIANALDAERKAGKLRGPLHGIPVLVKDNIDTADRMHTTAGSEALAGERPTRDAFIVERLRAAGAIVLGKTNLSEWANFRSTHSSSGWSARGGQARNPYALDRSPSGSSSGSGIAAASNYCTVAIGTETDGSITSPSAACSLVGLKPTVELVSRSGIVPISHTQDTAGPMTRTVADAAVLLGAMAGADARDSATRTTARKAQDYAGALDPHGLKGARIGIVRDCFGSNDRVDRVVEEGIAAMKSAGAIVVDAMKMPAAERIATAEFDILKYEFKHNLDAYLRGLGPSSPVHSLADVIEFNTRNAATEMPYFGQEIFTDSQSKGPLTDKHYRKALATARALSRAQGIDAALAKDRLDALVAPTGPLPWMIDYASGDHASGGCTQMPAVSGYPHITVPAGFAFGLPVGISFFAGAYSEAKLIRLAYAFEQLTKARRSPQFLATAPLRA
jgi:amidase